MGERCRLTLWCHSSPRKAAVTWASASLYCLKDGRVIKLTLTLASHEDTYVPRTLVETKNLTS